MQFFFLKKGKAFNPKIKFKRKWFNISCEHPKKGFLGFVFTLGSVEGGSLFQQSLAPWAFLHYPKNCSKIENWITKWGNPFKKSLNSVFFFSWKNFAIFRPEKKRRNFWKFWFFKCKVFTNFSFFGV